MQQLISAAKAALEAMEQDATNTVSQDAYLSAREALRAALDAQKQPEPVATLHDDGYFTWKRDEFRLRFDRQRAGWRMDVYASPPPQPVAVNLNDEGPSNAAHWHKRATEAEARCAVLEMKLEAARRELAKVNNEFGSENADWPEAWRRVAEVKERAGRLWRDNETLRAALSEVLEVVSLPAAPAPVQQPVAVPAGCLCRWVGEQQTVWCSLHLAHEEAIHEWAQRAKTAEQKLAAAPAAPAKGEST